MAIPSGSGSEVLKHTIVRTLSNTWTTLQEFSANHIYTIISIVITNQDASDEVLNMGFADDASNTNLSYIVIERPIPGYGTFVWNDRIVINGAKFLRAAFGSSADGDVHISYIDQDWT
jgi:hypothetical protein